MYSRLAWTSAGKDQSWQVIIHLLVHVGFFGYYEMFQVLQYSLQANIYFLKG